MEFFAWIGIITVIWIIYDVTKYVFIDSYKEIEEENAQIARMLSENEDFEDEEEVKPENNLTIVEEIPKTEKTEKPCPKGTFVYNLEDAEALKKPVFKPLPGSKTNEEIKEFNLNLKRIGTYARLYYHLIDVFEVPESHYRAQYGVKVKIYDSELIRREVEERIFKGKSKKKVEPLRNDDIEILKFENSELRIIYATVQSAYSGLRNKCLKKIESEKSRELRLEKINAVLDTEKVLFKNEPVWRDYFKQLTEPHLERIMNECNELGPH